MGKKYVLTIFCFALASIFALTLASGITLAAKKAADVAFEKAGDAGPVTFSHEKHKGAKLKCTECHKKGKDPYFKMKAGKTAAAGLKHKGAMNEGQHCGACHNGTKAFEFKDNCAKCHKK